MSTDWIKKWEAGNIAFHQSQYHPLLEKFADRFTMGTILIPLSGKSLDMVFLASLGHSVLGVELSPIACQSFFQENGISFTERKVDGFILYESYKVKLWCGDFFKLPAYAWDDVTGLYDRAALIALPQDLRHSYSTEISQKSKKQLEILLISLEYPEGAIEGPPFSVPEQEIFELYPDFNIQKIHLSNKVKTSNPRLQSIELTEAAYWISSL